MSTTRHNFLRGTTILLLTGLVVTAGISLSQIRSLSLPISAITATAALILPFVTGVGLQQAQALVTRSTKPHAPHHLSLSWKPLAALVLLTIYETAIATLALTHMAPPSDLACHLDQQWARLYSNKNAAAIRRIQDVHQCCGLHHVKEKAWPFQDQNHAADACATMFERQESCFRAWRRDEQVYAGLLLLVAVVSFFIKLSLYLLYRTRSSFFHAPQSRYHTITAGDAEDDTANGPNGRADGVRGRIEGAYHDDPEAGADGGGSDGAAERNGTDNVGSTDRGPTVQPSRLRHEGDGWRE